MARKLSEQSGFSLPEIMIVLVIAGVIIAAVLPDFHKLIGRYSLDGATRELVADIRAVQQNALRHESNDFYLLFNEMADSYYLIDTSRGVTPYQTRQLPAGVDLAYTTFRQTNQDRLSFAWTGNPVYRFGGHITLKDRATGATRYVIIDSIGRVRVSETPPEKGGAFSGVGG